LAAVLGVVLPALLYLALNPSGEAARAWGVVISTDTAFALGLLALAGPACPAQVRVFLLTLAIADDVGALAVIAVVYTDDLAPGWLVLASAGIALMVAMHRWVWRGPPYFVVAVGVWLATHASGVHPTLAGVAMALLVAAPSPRPADVHDAVRLTRAFS
jgi:Na+/H+ antiporter NhaA